MLGVLGWILFGLVVGIIAKLLMPGSDPQGCIITMVIGVLGAVIGGFIGTWLGFGSVTGFDLRSFIIAVVGAKGGVGASTVAHNFAFALSETVQANTVIVDYDLPIAGAFHNCCIVSIRKAYPGHAQKVMHAIWGLGMLSLTKSVVVVDEWVDVHDYEEVMFRVGANVDPQRDVLITEGPLDHLDHAPTRQFYGGKIGIDATHKGPQEGTREWPPVSAPL